MRDDARLVRANIHQDRHDAWATLNVPRSYLNGERLMRDGLTNREIATELGSVSTR
jgi:hypothetical protein